MEYQLQIEFVHKKKNIINFFKSSDIIQTKIFWLGLSIKNVGNQSLKSATIKNIRWTSPGDQKVFAQISKNFSLNSLNPGEEIKIWIEETGTYAYGVCNIYLDISSDVENEVIKTFQINPFTKEKDFCQNNSWTDFFFIRSKSEYEQNKINFFVFYFAFISTLAAILSLYFAHLQTNYAEIASREQRIFQAQSIQAAIDLCDSNHELTESGLYDTAGLPASCSAILKEYKN